MFFVVRLYSYFNSFIFYSFTPCGLVCKRRYLKCFGHWTLAISPMLSSFFWAQKHFQSCLSDVLLLRLLCTSTTVGCFCTLSPILCTSLQCFTPIFYEHWGSLWHPVDVCFAQFSSRALVLGKQVPTIYSHTFMIHNNCRFHCPLIRILPWFKCTPLQ